MDVRGPFRASMTFATREGTSLGESVAAAAGGLEVPVPQPEVPESVSANESTIHLRGLLANYAAPGVTDDDVRRLAQTMVGSVSNRPEGAMLIRAYIASDRGEGLVLLGPDHTWAVWMHADPLRPFLGRRPSGP